MTNEQPEIKVNANIPEGNATVVGTEDGWVIPGGRIIRGEARARMYARRMARLMTKLEVA